MPPKKIKCPNCGAEQEVNIGRLLGAAKTAAKKKAALENLAKRKSKGGRPKGSKNKPKE